MARVKILMSETVTRWKEGQTYIVAENLAKQLIENNQATLLETITGCGCKKDKKINVAID